MPLWLLKDCWNPSNSAVQLLGLSLSHLEVNEGIKVGSTLWKRSLRSFSTTQTRSSSLWRLYQAFKNQCIIFLQDIALQNVYMSMHHLYWQQVYLNKFLHCHIKQPIKVVNIDTPDVNHQVCLYLLPRWQTLTHLMINITSMGMKCSLCAYALKSIKFLSSHAC